MVTKTKSKRQRDIKSKLIAAVCMLLVSTIMMVSSTYAWFTLSTAPEVTGITTSVGANGNLEMALLPLDGDAGNITSEAGDSVKADVVRNLTWGNLVDLSNEDYGLNKIMLYPSELNIATDGKIDSGAILKTPAYGADGRVSELLKNTVTSTYDKNNDKFPTNSEYGVRAIGTASGMTDQQLAYRNARAAANTAMSQAKSEAAKSLNTNGNALANIAIAHGANAEATHTLDDVAALKAIVNDLLGYDTTTGDATTHKTGVLEYIEEAYIQYIYAYAASARGSEAAYTAVKGLIAGGKSLSEILETDGVTVPTELAAPVAALQATITNVNAAKTALDGITSETVEWSAISVPLNKLANVDDMKINGYAVGNFKAHMSEIINSVASQGLTVTMATGGGVYADIADHCGDYNAQVVIQKVEYNGLVLENMNAKMETKTTVTNTYLSVISVAVEGAGAPAGTGNTDMPITDTFGYIVDLAFRTNAAESNLLLQTEGIDRIYGENGTEQTMGAGASMTFTPTTTDFESQDVKDLMKAIRIVFFDPGSWSIFANGMLNTNTATIGADGVTVTAPIQLYTGTIGGTETMATYTLATSFTEGTTYYTKTPGTAADYDAWNWEDETTTYENAAAAFDAVKGKLFTLTGTETYSAVASDAEYVEGTTYYVQTTAATKESYREAEGIITAENFATSGELYTKSSVSSEGYEILDGEGEAVITALTQNTAQRVSVLVYLDGNSITNSNVAANATTSVTGKMNLQFASSANLMPMEYTPLLDPNSVASGGDDGDDDDDDEATTYNVTVPAGVTGEATATAGTDYTFTVDTASYTLGEVTVGGTAVTPTAGADGAYTIPAASVTGAIVINVTANAAGQ